MLHGRLFVPLHTEREHFVFDSLIQFLQISTGLIPNTGILNRTCCCAGFNLLHVVCLELLRGLGGKRAAPALANAFAVGWAARSLNFLLVHHENYTPHFEVQNWLHPIPYQSARVLNWGNRISASQTSRPGMRSIQRAHATSLKSA
jgi:hypothetical protein